MGADYEAAFGDIFDVTLTGVIDRNLEERKVGDKVKKYATNTVRKLYFRGTTLIDAGGRFAYGAVPEYMVFDKPNMAADFIRVVEEGMEKSKSTISKKATPVKEEKIAEPDPVEEDDIDDINIPVEDTIEETTETSTYPDDLDAVIRKMYKECKDAELKVSVKNVIAEYGKLNDVDEDGLKKIYDMMN